jgi:DNA-binding XRE family transcriptional regulator
MGNKEVRMMRKEIKSWREMKGSIDEQFTKEELLEMNKRIALANMIISERNKRGWTQTDLAVRAGLHQVQISRIENGDKMPSYRTLSKIAAAFHLMVGFVPIEKSL